MRFQKLLSVLLSWTLWASSMTPITTFAVPLYTTVDGQVIDGEEAHQEYDVGMHIVLLEQDFQNKMKSAKSFANLHEAEKEIEAKSSTLEKFQQKYSEIISQAKTNPKLKEFLSTPAGQNILKRHKKISTYLAVGGKFNKCIKNKKKSALWGAFYDTTDLDYEGRISKLLTDADVGDVSLSCAIENADTILNDGMFGASGYMAKISEKIDEEVDDELHKKLMTKSLANAAQSYANFRANYDQKWLTDIVRKYSAIDKKGKTREEVRKETEKNNKLMANEIKAEMARKDVKSICKNNTEKDVACTAEDEKLILNNMVKAIKGSLLPADNQPKEEYDPRQFHDSVRRKYSEAAEDLSEALNHPDKGLNPMLVEINQLTSGRNWAALDFKNSNNWTSSEDRSKTYEEFKEAVKSGDIKRDDDVHQAISGLITQVQKENPDRVLNNVDKDRIVAQVYEQTLRNYETGYGNILKQRGEDGKPGIGALMLAPGLVGKTTFRDPRNPAKDKEYVEGNTKSTTFKMHPSYISEKQIRNAVEGKNSISSKIAGSMGKLLEMQKWHRNKEEGTGYFNPFVNNKNQQLNDNLKFLVVNNPKAVAEILIDNPGYVGRLCKIIDEVYSDKNTSEMVDTGLVTAGVIGLGAMALTGAGSWLAGPMATGLLSLSSNVTMGFLVGLGFAETVHWNNRYYEQAQALADIEGSFLSNNTSSEALIEMSNEYRRARDEASFNFAIAAPATVIDAFTLGALGIPKLLAKSTRITNIGKRAAEIAKASKMIRLTASAIRKTAGLGGAIAKFVHGVGETTRVNGAIGGLIRGIQRMSNSGRRKVAMLLNASYKAYSRLRNGAKGAGRWDNMEKIIADTMLNMIKRKQLSSAETLEMYAHLGTAGQKYLTEALADSAEHHKTLKLISSIDNLIDSGIDKGYKQLAGEGGKFGLLADSKKFDKWVTNKENEELIKDVFRYAEKNDLHSLAEKLAKSNNKKVIKQTREVLENLVSGKNPIDDIKKVFPELDGITKTDLAVFQKAMSDAQDVFRNKMIDGVASEVATVKRAINESQAAILGKRTIVGTDKIKEGNFHPVKDNKFWKNLKENKEISKDDVIKWVDANLAADRVSKEQALAMIKKAKRSGFNLLSSEADVGDTTRRLVQIGYSDLNNAKPYNERLFSVPGKKTLVEGEDLFNELVVKHPKKVNGSVVNHKATTDKVIKFVEDGLENGTLRPLEADNTSPLFGLLKSVQSAQLKGKKGSVKFKIAKQLQRIGDEGSQTREIGKLLGKKLNNTRTGNFAGGLTKAEKKILNLKPKKTKDLVSRVPRHEKIRRSTVADNIQFVHPDGRKMNLTDLASELKIPARAQELNNAGLEQLAKGFGFELSPRDIKRMMENGSYQGILNTVVDDIKLVDTIIDPDKLKKAKSLIERSKVNKSIDKVELKAAKKLVKKHKNIQKQISDEKGYKLFAEHDKATQAVVLGILKQLENADDTAGIAKANRSIYKPWTWLRRQHQTVEERAAGNFLNDIWNLCAKR